MAEETKYPSVFACPHCGESFEAIQNSVRCVNGHTFDRAREGYLNLLVGGRLSTNSTPGDTPESLAARRRFLSTGAYMPIVDALANTIGDLDGAVLDIGCGEGYYLSHIRAQHRFGLDIAKRGVQMASKSYPDAEFVVGTAYRLPVLNDSCDAVFSVFAPHSIEEFQRVLSPCGQWVTVTPAAHHLHQMRPKRDENILERERRRDEPPEHATNAQRVQFDLELTEESANDLFSMTPLVWQTAADAAPVTRVSVDVWVASGFKS
ncbi:MAG: rRNA ((745)-N(1))-methyltransferase [Actinomycetota bacterium]|jgi:23S rRNA (guanine745-N1)-methyltransferase